MTKYDILKKLLKHNEDKAEKVCNLVQELAGLHVQQSKLLLHKPFYEIDHDEYNRIGELIEAKKQEIEELRK